MPFKLIPFKSCDINDCFFDSLKEDYSDFESWFAKKCAEGKFAYVWKEGDHIHGFLYIKDEPECEPVGDLPAEPRMKIGTLKIDDSIGGQRIGEGAVGMALWKWAKSDLKQIYVTIFPKHEELIKTVEGFGFTKVTMKGDEGVYVKDRTSLDLSNPKKYFPFFIKNCRGKILPINPDYHDLMFPYSEIKNADQSVDLLPVSNGITKIYLAYTGIKLDYRINDLVFIYRKSEDDEYKSYKSAVSSFCVVSAFKTVKLNGESKLSKEQFRSLVGNKTVYSEVDLESAYNQKNLHFIELLYCGYFGSGNNVNYKTLKKIGAWKEGHPYGMLLTFDDIAAVLQEGGVNV